MVSKNLVFFFKYGKLATLIARFIDVELCLTRRYEGGRRLWNTASDFKRL